MQTDDVVGPAERAAALGLLRQQKPDREIKFNRNGGLWVSRRDYIQSRQF